MEPEKRDQGRILVVDDEESVSRLLQQWLAAEGYAVRCACDFDEVRRCMEQERFDLMTLDIMMPEVGGLEILRWVREQHPDVGVVMATAIGDLSSVLEAMRAGAVNYLLKPFNMDLVSEEIGRGMERQRLIAENRAYQRELERKVEARTRELREAHAQLEQKVRELEGRDRLVQLQMSPPADARQAEVEIVRIVAGMLEAEKASIFRPDETGDALTTGGGDAGEEQRIPLDAEEEPVCQAFRTGESRVGAEGEVIVPILYDREVLGVLRVEGMREEGKQDDAFDRLWYLGREIALVLRMTQMAADLATGGTELEMLLQMEEEEVGGDG